MLYISLVLAALGIIFIIITIVKNTEKDTIKPGKSSIDTLNDLDVIPSPFLDEELANQDLEYTVKNKKTDVLTDDMVLLRPDDLQKQTGIREVKTADDDNLLNDLNEAIPLLDDDMVQIFPDSNMDTTPGSLQGSGIKSVLYEDSSGLIDYKNITSSIDPSFDEYKRIRRQGQGIIEVQKFGINFKTGKNIFRFDFHRISEIWSGPNFLALSVKGSDKIKLFLIFDKSVTGNKLKESLYARINA